MNSFHLDVWDMERAWDTPRDEAWSAYLAEVEGLMRLAGIEPGGCDGGLDGDIGHGLSIDGAHDAFCAGRSPSQYVATRRPVPALLLAHGGGVMLLDGPSGTAEPRTSGKTHLRSACGGVAAGLLTAAALLGLLMLVRLP